MTIRKGKRAVPRAFRHFFSPPLPNIHQLTILFFLVAIKLGGDVKEATEPNDKPND